MLEINDQKRGSGKTTKAIEMLREDKNSICIVPFSIHKKSYPDDVSSQVLTERDIFFKSILTRSTKVIIDELAMSKFKTATLFYELGRLNIDVIVFGTDENGY